MTLGNQPTDNGNLIIGADEYETFSQNQELKPFIKKMLGSKELIHSIPRYCLWLVNAPKSVLANPELKTRLERCRTFRSSSKKAATRRDAKTPHLFQDRRFDTPPQTAIAIPRVSSERRGYIPMGFVDSDTVISDSCYQLPEASIFDFGILESRMHMTWMRTVCGRLESRYRYSRDLCYNTFPWPQVNQKQKEQIENLATNVLIAREMHPEMTLAELYDPDKMPDDLKKAHQELDLAVDCLYRKKGFESDEDRLQHLFKRYEALVNGEDVTLFED